MPPKFILTNALISVYYHTLPAVTCRHVLPTPKVSVRPHRSISCSSHRCNPTICSSLCIFQTGTRPGQWFIFIYSCDYSTCAKNIPIFKKSQGFFYPFIFFVKSLIASEILICCGQTASQLLHPIQAEGCFSFGTACNAIGAINPPSVKECSLYKDSREGISSFCGQWLTQ